MEAILIVGFQEPTCDLSIRVVSSLTAWSRGGRGGSYAKHTEEGPHHREKKQQSTDNMIDKNEWSLAITYASPSVGRLAYSKYYDPDRLTTQCDAMLFVIQDYFVKHRL